MSVKPTDRPQVLAPTVLLPSARLRHYEQRAFHVADLPDDVISELGSIPISEAAAKFDYEYKTNISNPPPPLPT